MKIVDVWKHIKKTILGTNHGFAGDPSFPAPMTKLRKRRQKIEIAFRTAILSYFELLDYLSVLLNSCF